MEAKTLPPTVETLLVIDDEPLMTELFRQFMTKRGFRVLTAVSGPQAFDILEAECGAVRLIITDMALPTMNGIEIAHELAVRAPGVPVLIATGHDRSMADSGLPSNVVEIIQKPYQNRVLADRVRCILDGCDLNQPPLAAPV